MTRIREEELSDERDIKTLIKTHTTSYFTFYAWHIDQFACYHVVAEERTVPRAKNYFMSILTEVGCVDRKRFQKHTLYTRIV